MASKDHSLTVNFSDILNLNIYMLTLERNRKKTGMFFSQKRTICVTHRLQKHLEYVEGGYLCHLKLICSSN